MKRYKTKLLLQLLPALLRPYQLLHHPIFWKVKVKQHANYIKVLQNNLLEQFSKAQQESGQNKKISISLAETKTLDLNRFGQDRDVEESKELSTRELYQTAKAFITALKSLDQQYEA